MGLYASYYALPQEIIELCYSDVDKYFDEFNKINFVEPNNCCHLLKLWYVIHFLCTGYNDNSKFNDKKSKEHLYLYYAFCGVYEIPNIENRGIVPNHLMSDLNFYLQKIDLRKIIQNIVIKNINFDKIYLNLTIDDFRDNEFIEQLVMIFENFQQFYQNALKNNYSVLITIC